MNSINVSDVIIPDDQRELRPHQVARLRAKLKSQGYNTSYPITIEEDNNTLVDGGHRIAAAIAEGIDTIPYVFKPVNVSRIQHAIRCNEDGADTQPHDVFDYAELCWRYNGSGKDLAEELGWTATQVSYYKQIKERLHPYVWQIARLTKNPVFVNGDLNSLVNQELTIVNFTESHFRALLKHLPYINRATYRAQLKLINECIDRFIKGDKKVTAKWIEDKVQTYAWHIRLAEYMRNTLTNKAPLSDWRYLLKAIKTNVFGDKSNDKSFNRFVKAIAAINENILGIQLLQGDCFDLISQMENDSISLIVTDPPYNVTEYEWDKIGTDTEYIEFIRKWLQLVKPKLKSEYHLFICISPHYQADIEQLLKAEDWPIKSRIIWAHRNLAHGQDNKDKFINMWDMIFHCGTHTLNWSPDWNDERFEVQEWAIPQSNFKKDRGFHETQKPLGLFELFVKIGSKPGDIVLDTFAGSGTTGEACKNIGQRKCILMESNNEYCEIVEGRLGVWRELSE